MEDSNICVVIGPPCAGKSTFVDENRAAGDVVVDYDKIAFALGSDVPHAASGDIRAAAFTGRSAVIGDIMAGKISRAWIIHTSPTQDMIGKYQDAGFRFECVNPGIDLCMDRADKDNRPEGTKETIQKWFDDPVIIAPDKMRGSFMIENCEKRGGIPAEIRAESDGLKVSGYAAVFGQEADIGGMFREVIEAGAFADAIGRDDVVFLVNHEGLPLARTRSGTLKLSEDDHGLRMMTTLDADDPDVKAIAGKMRRGDLDKMSFAFVPDVQEWDESGDIPLRTIKRATLYDVSIVTTPAYDGTEIGLRSLDAFRAEQKQRNFMAARTRLRMKRDLAQREKG